MMRKFMMVLGAIIALLVPAVAMAPVPAYAATWSTEDCIKYNASGPGDGVKTCLAVTWSDQGDGSGVVLQAMRVDTEYGCSTLKEWPYGDLWAYMENPRNGNHVWSKTQDYAKSCDFAWTGIDARGSDKYSMDVYLGMQSRATFPIPDDWLEWKVNIEPDGGRTWIFSRHEECSSDPHC